MRFTAQATSGPQQVKFHNFDERPNQMANGPRAGLPSASVPAPTGGPPPPEATRLGAATDASSLRYLQIALEEYYQAW